MDADDFKEIADQPEEWRSNPMLQLMERHCASGFPYVCGGRKLIVEGTDVRCECGARMRA